MILEAVSTLITPALAEEWLNANKTNRKLRDGLVEEYAGDMRAGRWTECPEPISFYADGDLADGQHRLWAICESGKAQTFFVVRGLSRAAGLNLNTGLGRTLVDNARISGVETGLSSTLVIAARAIHFGSASPPGQSNAATLALVEQHREAAQFATTNVRRVRLLCGGVVLGAVGRAYMYEPDATRLMRFCDVFGTGLYDGDPEVAAVIARNYMLTKGSVASSSALWRDSFLRLQHAIRMFCQGKKMTVSKVITEEPYPLRATKTVKRVKKTA